ncbi:radical SAM protein [Desulfogranum mediterraneum]|uniref:radical SAM protein n=1 Tax=Desulfogranum mediterraneum TaxID=160661 RepID=UPI0003FE04E7|nr:radical SAM protein [Desulfogranum mediterraneum]
MTSQPLARTVGFKSGERNVFLHLLTACNLSCRHCYINPEQHGTQILPLATVLSWLQLLLDPDKASNLILLGGEPTLHPDLAAIIKAAKAMGYAVTVDTNGLLCHQLLDQVTPLELDYLSFSLDGPDAAVNDPIRGEGVFERCSANIRKAVTAGFAVSLIYTVSGLNIDHLQRMPELVARLGVRRFFIQVIGLRGKSAGGEAPEVPWQVDPEQWLEIVPRVALAAAEKGIHVVYPKVYLEPGETFECAGRVAENYFVFPNGRVYQCPLCEDHPIHSMVIEEDQLRRRSGLNEDRFFQLAIPEGCVMNKLLQPENISYLDDGSPSHQISCCLLKQEVLPLTPTKSHGSRKDDS